jgi:hypothetical protein
MWSWQISALPLVMEVRIRNGYTELFLKVLSHVDTPTAAVAIMMVQLEETVSVNFNIFSLQELKQMPAAFKPLLEMTVRHIKTATAPNANKKDNYFLEAKAIQESTLGFLKECQQAEYWYTVGALRREPNMEGRKRQKEGRGLPREPWLRAGYDRSVERSGKELQSRCQCF